MAKGCNCFPRNANLGLRNLRDRLMLRFYSHPSTHPKMKIRLLSALLLALPSIALLPLSSLAAAANPPGGPTVTVNEPLAVTVAGPVEVQGAVEVLNDALKVPYNRRFEVTLTNGISTLTGTIGGLTAGKRLVIETIGVRVRAEPGQKVLVQLGGNGVASIDTFFLPLPLVDHGEISTRQQFLGAHAVKMMIDPRVINALVISMARSASTGTLEAAFTVCGYLEDLPATAP